MNMTMTAGDPNRPARRPVPTVVLAKAAVLLGTTSCEPGELARVGILDPLPVGSSKSWSMKLVLPAEPLSQPRDRVPVYSPVCWSDCPRSK